MSSTTAACRYQLAQARIIAPVGSGWLHYKGGTYQVTGLEIDTGDGSARIQYQRIAGPGFDHEQERDIRYSRPLSEWTEDRFKPEP